MAAPGNEPHSLEEYRFGSFARLVGREGALALRSASACVVGLGGVGSWVVEALARCGIGNLTLVDLDDVCVTNFNRQLHALSSTVGLPKTEVMAARVLDINPACHVVPVTKFFSEDTADLILKPEHSIVIDAIDRVTNKTLLVHECLQRGLPILCSGSAAGRLNSLAIRVDDLGAASHDRLLFHVRKRLRQRFGYSKGRRNLGVSCVYIPHDGTSANGLCADGSPTNRTCESGLGTASFVTGALGLALAAEAANAITASAGVMKSGSAEPQHILSPRPICGQNS